MSSWGLADFIVFFSVPLLVFLLILRIFSKTNILIYIILVFLIPSVIYTSIITPFIDNHTSSSWHQFQKDYEYATYYSYISLPNNDNNNITFNKEMNSIAVDNLKAIKNISNINLPLLLIDKKNTSLGVYDGKNIVNKIQLKNIPKAALYGKDRKIIYVIYENQKGLEILSMKEDFTHIKLQNEVKSTISKAVSPFWEYIFSHNNNDIENLRVYLLDNIHANFNYKVYVYINRYEVLVTSSDRENINIKFTFLKKDEFVIDEISFSFVSVLGENGYPIQLD